MKPIINSFGAIRIIGSLALGAMVIARTVGAIETNGSDEVSADAANLILQIEREANTPQAVNRNAAGNVCSLHIYFRFASDTNLALVSEIKSLTNITLRTSSINKSLTPAGIKKLQNMPNLVSFGLECANPMPDGILAAACQNQALRYFYLWHTKPPSPEFNYLTNLTRLEELIIAEVSNFGDDDLRLLTALPSLKQLTLFETRVSKDWPSIVRQFPALTNAVVTSLISTTPRERETLTWQRGPDR